MRLRTIDLLSDEVRQALKKLGEHLRIARKRRRESLVLCAQRLATTPTTIRKMEVGDPSVSAALYFGALSSYGFQEQFGQLGHPDFDALGKSLELSRLPKRIKSQPLDNDF